ncbi:MAG: cell division protein ZapA [Maricaulaceae bacterium]
MAKVTVSVNGRPFTVGCASGEEGRVRELGGLIDRYVRELTDKFGQIGDVKLFLMAGLQLADALKEAQDELAELRSQSTGLARQEAARAAADRDRLIAQLNAASERIEHLCALVGHPEDTASAGTSEPEEGDPDPPETGDAEAAGAGPLGGNVAAFPSIGPRDGAGF